MEHPEKKPGKAPHPPDIDFLQLNTGEVIRRSEYRWMQLKLD